MIPETTEQKARHERLMQERAAHKQLMQNLRRERLIWGIASIAGIAALAVIYWCVAP